VRYRKAVSALALGCMLVGALGCADERLAPRAPASSGEVLRGTVYVRESDEPEAKQLAAAVSSKLVAVGFPVVATTNDPHELVVILDVALRETTGILTVYVNGQPKKTYRARATVRFMGPTAVLSEQSIEYDADDGPSEDQLRALVSMARASGVQRYLAQSRQRARAEATRHMEAQEDAAEVEREQRRVAQREQRRQEEAAWARVVLSECKAPTQLDGCNLVKDYLSSYPTGAHAAEARQALEAGAPLIAKLADERDWRVARPESCATPKEITDCDGVTSYMAAQPAGAHVEEARRLLAKAEPKLAAARKAEEKRARDEDAKAERDAERVAQEEKRRQRDQCKKETCLGGMCFNVRPGAFEICMDRCVKANCE
jgi:hypothetical protein